MCAVFRGFACATLALTTGCATSTGINSPSSPIALASTVSISGASHARVGTTVQFVATISNSGSSAVSWQVNGVAGGSAAAGTISSGGLYTAPATLPSPNTVSVTAVSKASASASATVSEAIWNPVPIVSAATAVQTGSGSNIALDVTGSAFVQGAQIVVGGAAVPTTLVSATELRGTAGPSTGLTTLAIAVLNPNPGAASSAIGNAQIQRLQASLTAAARLLDQATFGPTLNDIQHVQQVGLDGYLTEQFAAAPTIEPDIATPPPAVCATNTILCQQSEWWRAALTGNDQLRQRVAFAFAEIFVISTNSVHAESAIPFQNMLVKDAFGNFSTLLQDMTLSTGMGAYLNMLNSAKPASGQIANENYAREAMQLFTIGLYELNQDGTPQLDGSGNRIPSYTQAQVQAFARAYTGWTYATATGGSPTTFPNNAMNFDAPMALVAAQHDTTAKTLLNGTVLPAGQTGTQDLAGALGNLFAHRNLGPFLCRQLIQHLVASNPSPAYVSRVAAVFADNGSGVRGDLKAVVRAILMDTEARAGDTDPTFEGGHLREPILYLTGVMRGLSFVNTDPTGYYGTLSNYTAPLGQKPYAAGSVFNFFPPDYAIPGTTATAPEFSIENTASTMLRLTLANSLVYNSISGFKLDLSAASALGLMAANPGNLVDSLGVIFMHGQMPAGMRSAIVNHISTLTDPAQRARVATYLTITSSLYKVEH